RQLWLIDKENGGKADALNAGINYCRAPLFCAIDADTLLERDGLLRVVQPFLEDSRTVAAGGIVRIANDCTVGYGQVVDVRLPKNELARLQVTEYLRAFLSGRVAWDETGMVLIISGAFGLFKRSLVVDVGGYSTDTVGEDMELVVRIHRHCRDTKIPYKVRFVPDPVAWTECPESISVLGRQRDRWQRGLAQVMVRHIKMLFNPRYGRVGMIAYPYFFFFEMLGPVMETIGYIVVALSIIFGMISPTLAIAFFAVAVVFGVALSAAAVTLEELSFHKYTRLSDLLRLFRVSVTENLGYRQLNAYWRMKGLYSYLKGDHSWGEMTRTGFAIGGGES
ncbi:MAG: glycosyltransferase, partial [Rhodothermia bacterium]|nr:glycosyltransferase [Rhodothermia bacterium]